MTMMVLQRVKNFYAADRPRFLGVEEAAAYLSYLLLEDGGFYCSGAIEKLPQGLRLSDTTILNAVRELNADGLLRDYEEKTDGRGRPRVMYAPANDAAVAALSEMAELWKASA